MNKIFFLIKNNTPFYIILIFLINKLSRMFVKRKIIKFKREHEKNIRNKKISNDYFSSHAYNFFIYLNQLNKNFRYLEIGSYEGNSALFIANTFPHSKVNCVDTWQKTNEYSDHKSFLKIENNFNHNILKYRNINKIKKSSDEFFMKNNLKFDVIYIDGYHYGPQVFKDCMNAWRFVEKGGFLICDDYIWDFYSNIKSNPCYAINRFINKNRSTCKIEKISNSQIFIKKII